MAQLYLEFVDYVSRGWQGLSNFPHNYLHTIFMEHFSNIWGLHKYSLFQIYVKFSSLVNFPYYSDKSKRITRANWNSAFTGWYRDIYLEEDNQIDWYNQITYKEKNMSVTAYTTLRSSSKMQSYWTPSILWHYTSQIIQRVRSKMRRKALNQMHARERPTCCLISTVQTTVEAQGKGECYMRKQSNWAGWGRQG